jgi:hypothetical protein
MMIEFIQHGRDEQRSPCGRAALLLTIKLGLPTSEIIGTIAGGKR